MEEDKLKKVLVIDDSETTRNLLNDELSALGYAVKAIEKAEDGLFRMQGNKFDVVFIDLKLPGMGGLELLQWITEEKIDVIPIIMTGYESPESIAEAVEKGAYGYIIKPIQPLQLNIAIKFALKRYEIEQKLRKTHA